MCWSDGIDLRIAHRCVCVSVVSLLVAVFGALVFALSERALVDVLQGFCVLDAELGQWDAGQPVLLREKPRLEARTVFLFPLRVPNTRFTDALHRLTHTQTQDEITIRVENKLANNEKCIHIHWSQKIYTKVNYKHFIKIKKKIKIHLFYFYLVY